MSSTLGGERGAGGRDATAAVHGALRGRGPDASAAVNGALRGRSSELARLDGLMAAASAGASEVVLLEGAAGIGKSRLVFEACRRAADEGLLVAAGSSDELDQVTPWGVLLRAFSSSEPALLDASELDSLGGLSDQRLAVMDRMRAALEAASQRGPALIALDDLQWADPPTLLALGELPLQLFSYPIAWLLARRPMPTTAALDAVVDRLAEAGATRLRLAPLAASDSLEVARDVAGDTPGVDLAEMIAGAEGNPFYITELLRAEASGESDAPRVPESVRSAVARHLRSLTPKCRRLLGLASVLGREFSLAEVAGMTGRPASRLLKAVQEALAAEVLIELSDRLAFRHDLLRQAIYEDLPESARVALHRDAADALRETGASGIRVAGQLAIGARPGDRAAIGTLNEAVAELTPTSPSAAADLQLRALELIDDGDDRRGEMVIAAVLALSLAGRRGEAVAAGEAYLAAYRPPPAVEAILQLELREAWVFERMQAYPTALPAHLLRDPAVDPAIVATAIACQHADEMWDGRGEAAERAFAEAFGVVAGGGRPFELATVAYLRVVNSMLRGRMHEVLEQAEAGLAAARQIERPATSGIHETLVAVALGANGRYRDALSMLRTALAATDASGRTYFSVQGQWLRSFYLLAQGKLADARSEAQAEAATAEKLGYSVHSSRGLAVLAETAIRQGDRDQARTVLSRFSSPAEAGPLPDKPWALALEADLRGDTASTAAALDPIRAQLERGCFVIAISQHQRLPHLVRMALDAGQHEAAASFAEAAEKLAAENPHVASILAAAANTNGLITGDEEPLRDAVQKAASSEARLLEAAAREDLGHVLTAGRKQQDAIAELEAAYAIYSQSGADHDAARVRAALRALGIRKRRSTVARPAHGWGSLTSSEAAVVELVAKGLTNREAANELFLSPATINTHLVHAFTKLGIRSRVELARIAAERPPAHD